MVILPYRISSLVLWVTLSPLIAFGATPDEAKNPVVLKGCGGTVACFDSAGARLATAGGSFCRVWDAKSYRAVTPPLSHGAKVEGVLWTSGDRRLITVGGNEAKFWDAASGRLVLTLKHSVPLWPAAVSKDGKFLVTGNGDNGAAVWDVATATKTREMDAKGALIGVKCGTGDVVLTFNKPKSVAWSGEVRLWHAADGSNIVAPIIRGDFFGSLPADVSDDGKRLGLAFGKGYEVRELPGMNKIGEKTSRDEFGVDAGYTKSVKFTSENGTLLVAYDVALQLFDMEKGTPKGKRVDVFYSGQWDIALSPDTKWIAVAGLAEYGGLWDTETGQRRWSFGARFTSCVAISPNGHIVAVGHDQGKGASGGDTDVFVDLAK